MVNQDFLISTTMDLPGYDILEHRGHCFGLVVRSMGIAKTLTGTFKGLRSGEVSEYTEVLEQARRHATDRLIENARALGGNAVLGMQFDSSEIGTSMSEIVAYGYAVLAERR